MEVLTSFSFCLICTLLDETHYNFLCKVTSSQLYKRLRAHRVVLGCCIFKTFSYQHLCYRQIWYFKLIGLARCQWFLLWLLKKCFFFSCLICFQKKTVQLYLFRAAGHRSCNGIKKTQHTCTNMVALCQRWNRLWYRLGEDGRLLPSF